MEDWSLLHDGLETEGRVRLSTQVMLRLSSKLCIADPHRGSPNAQPSQAYALSMDV